MIERKENLYGKSDTAIRLLVVFCGSPDDPGATRQRGGRPGLCRYRVGTTKVLAIDQRSRVGHRRCRGPRIHCQWTEPRGEPRRRIQREIRANIALAQQWQIPNLICFSGNRVGLGDQAGAEVTAQGLRRVARLAEESGVTLVIELLNSKVNHTDYQC